MRSGGPVLFAGVALLAVVSFVFLVLIPLAVGTVEQFFGLHRSRRQCHRSPRSKT